MSEQALIHRPSYSQKQRDLPGHPDTGTAGLRGAQRRAVAWQAHNGAVYTPQQHPPRSRAVREPSFLFTEGELCVTGGVWLFQKCVGHGKVSTSPNPTRCWLSSCERISPAVTFSDSSNQSPQFSTLCPDCFPRVPVIPD